MHSKVISTKLTSLTIAPRSSHELKFHFVPRRVNPEYRKQVTISNLTNPGEQHFLEFIANNVDRHNISFHSLFYKLALLPAPSVAASALVPVAPAVARRTTSARATADALSASTDVRRPLEELRSMPPDACRVAFNDVVARCSHVRAFSIRNISAQPLVLRLACASGHGSLAIYRQSRGLRDSAAETTDSSSHRGAQPSRTAPSTLVRTELSAVAGSGTAVEGIQDGAADSAHAATSKGSRREQLLQRFEERQQQHVPHHKGSVELEDVISPSGPRSGSAQARRRALVSVDEAAPAARGETVARGRALDVALMRAETSNATPELRGSAVRWPALGLPERRPEARPWRSCSAASCAVPLSWRCRHHFAGFARHESDGNNGDEPRQPAGGGRGRTGGRDHGRGRQCSETCRCAPRRRWRRRPWRSCALRGRWKTPLRSARCWLRGRVQRRGERGGSD